MIFTTPTTFKSYLDGRLYDFDGDGALIRDFYGRPWIVGFDDGGDPFVISIPYETEEPDRSHGDLDLPAYPVRLIKES